MLVLPILIFLFGLLNAFPSLQTQNGDERSSSTRVGSERRRAATLVQLQAETELNWPANLSGTYPVSAMPEDEVDTYLPYTHLTAAAYCNTTLLQLWQCGDHCSAVPGMITHSAGGNNSDTPDWYIGYLPALRSAVVVHQGTTPANILSDFIDVNFTMTSLDPTYFPGTNTTEVQVHNGFAQAHGRTADLVFAAVSFIFDEYGVDEVVCLGHSLGGAIAMLDALSLRLTLGNDTSVKLITYGQPRVGNQAFADLVDALLPDTARITNKLDYVPIVPGLGLGFHQSSGEKHIDSNGTWWACDGQDNESDPQCSTGAVASIFVGNETDHDGPYNGVFMGC